MDVRNCRDCGKIFNYISGPPLCPACMKLLDVKFDQVKAYIYDHPGAGIQEVSDENEVSTQQIKLWIRQERLTFSQDSPIGLDCEGCGAIIKTGRFCPACKNKMANNLGDVYREPAYEPVQRKDTITAPKMRFLDGTNKFKNE